MKEEDWLEYKNLINNLINLNDIMKVKFNYENITTHTMKIKEKKKEKKLDAWLYNKELSDKINNYWVNEFSNINSDHKPMYLNILFQIERYQIDKIKVNYQNLSQK